MNQRHHRITQDLITFLSGFDGFTAYGVIFGILFACGMGLPMPEDITLISSGVLAALGNISLAGAMVVGFVGVLVGDSILFFAGRRWGRGVFNLPVFRRVFTKERISIAEGKVLRNSKFICFTARFLPGLRAPIYLTSGIMGVNPVVFLALDGIAALISVPVWILLGYWFGQNLDSAFLVAKRMNKFIILGVLSFIGIYFAIKYLRRRRSSSPK